ncbi:MAG: DedA family protein [Oscillospiraceae bacterium]
MQELIIEMMNQFGYWGIALLIAIENIFPPIPSEVILTFGGFMTTYTDMNLWLVAFFSTIGSVVGALVLYGIGRILNEERLERWLGGKWGRILHLKPSDVKKADTWFQRKGKTTVFFCRFIPIVRSLISIPAGMSKMNLWVFLLLTTLGTSIWNIVLVWLGAIAGASWESIVGYIGIYSTVVLVSIGIGGLLFLYWFYKKRFKKKSEDEKKGS